MKKGGKLEWFLNQISDLLSADSGVLVPPTLSIVEFNGTFFLYQYILKIAVSVLGFGIHTIDILCTTIKLNK